MKNRNVWSFVIALSFGLVSAANAADSTGEPGRGADGPNPLKNVYFGEQHLHTGNSPDAFVVNGRQSWDEAYKFAMGE